jgi:hypothetical protein
LYLSLVTEILTGASLPARAGCRIPLRDMTNDEERCARARKLQRIDDAFRAGDLAALRAAVDDPGAVPNGHVDDTIGTCLVYAIYHSPLEFIRELLALGANPNVPVDDGFPPLIAALTKSRSEPGSPARPDVDEVVRLLLAHGVDPNQRGINDYTPLHMAVAMRNLLAVHRLLEGGADPELRTRIDDCTTALEDARAARLDEFVAVLERRGRPLGRRLRSGVVLLMDVPGEGELARRQHAYRVRMRMWLGSGEPVRWTAASGPVGAALLEDGGATLVTEIRVNRGLLVNGLFYGVEDMRVGGTRRLQIAPHMGYGDRGVPGIIPPSSTLVVEITILSVVRSP